MAESREIEERGRFNASERACLLIYWADKVSKEDWEILAMRLKSEDFSEGKDLLDLIFMGSSLYRPFVVLLLSLCFGWLGVDRFYLGKWGSGLAKLVLFWFVIGMLWMIVDWVWAYKHAQKKNYQSIQSSLELFFQK